MIYYRSFFNRNKDNAPSENPFFLRMQGKDQEKLSDVCAKSYEYRQIRQMPALGLYWLFPIGILIYALFGNPNTPEFVWWVFLAAIACGLPLVVTQYSGLSFVSIIAFTHMIYYPLAVLLNLMASWPGVYEQYLWMATPLAMQAVALGMVGLAIGAKLHDIFWPSQTFVNSPRAEEQIISTSRFKVFFLVLLIIPFVLFLLVSDSYYHILAKGASEWSESNALRFGYVGYIEYIVSAGILLQWRRFSINRSRTDLILAVLSILLPVIVWLPSGSRDRILRGVFPVLFAMFLGFQKQRISLKRILRILGLFIITALMMLAIETYRQEVRFELINPTPTERILSIVGSIEKTITKLPNEFDRSLQNWGRRAADYPVVGQIIQYFPNVETYRGIEDVEYWPIYILPSPIRPGTSDFDPRDSASLCARVGVFYGQGSCPGMTIGDLYSRFSWLGVFLGMALLGLIYRTLDKQLLQFGLFDTLLYGLLLIPIFKNAQESIFGHFMLLSRTLLIVYVIAYILSRFVKNSNAINKIK